jgi:hypothetical protein
MCINSLFHNSLEIFFFIYLLVYKIYSWDLRDMHVNQKIYFMDLIPPLGTLLRLIPTLLEESETWIHLPVYISEK